MLKTHLQQENKKVPAKNKNMWYHFSQTNLFDNFYVVNNDIGHEVYINGTTPDEVDLFFFSNLNHVNFKQGQNYRWEHLSILDEPMEVPLFYGNEIKEENSINNISSYFTRERTLFLYDLEANKKTKFLIKENKFILQEQNKIWLDK